MINFDVIFLLALIWHANAMGPVWNHTDRAQASMDKLANRMVNEMIGRELAVSSLHLADLDETTVGKPSHLAISSGTSTRLLPKNPNLQHIPRDFASPVTSSRRIPVSAESYMFGSRQANGILCAGMNRAASLKALKESAAVLPMSDGHSMMSDVEAKSLETQQKMRVLKNDPEFKHAFEEMDNGGAPVIMEYYNNPDFLRKVGERLDDIPAMRLEDAQQVGAAMAQSKEMQEKIRTLRDDPELKPVFAEMGKGGAAAVTKLGCPSMMRMQSGARSTVVHAARRAPDLEPDDSFFNPALRTPARTISIACVWAGLISYAALGAPGKDAVHTAIDNEILMKLIANPFDPTVAPLFSVLFNFMGIWPAWYAAALLPGGKNQKPLPIAPFVAGSVAVGAFALSPYLSLREYRGEDSGVTQADLNGVSRWFEGKLNAAILAAGAVGLSAYGLTANGGDVAGSISEFVDLWKTQLFVHVTSLDFAALWALSFGVMAEDMERRGMDKSKAPLFCAVPILGHVSYLLLRPPLPEE